VWIFDVDALVPEFRLVAWLGRSGPPVLGAVARAGPWAPDPHGDVGDVRSGWRFAGEPPRPGQGEASPAARGQVDLERTGAQLQRTRRRRPPEGHDLDPVKGVDAGDVVGGPLVGRQERPRVGRDGPT
jgi:hypothetical protein